jgi:hypothetical protein
MDEQDQPGYYGEEHHYRPFDDPRAGKITEPSFRRRQRFVQILIGIMAILLAAVIILILVVVNLFTTFSPKSTLPVGSAVATAAATAPIVATSTSVVPTPTSMPTAPPTQQPTPIPTVTSFTHTDASHMLNHSWSGIFHQIRYGSYPMILTIKTAHGQNFTGTLGWPTLSDNITNITGVVINNFGDASEQYRWEQVAGYNSSEGGTWLKFNEISYIQGSCVVLGGWYYSFLHDSSVMNGTYFFPNNNRYSGQKAGNYTITQKS